MPICLAVCLVLVDGGDGANVAVLMGMAWNILGHVDGLC